MAALGGTLLITGVIANYLGDMAFQAELILLLAAGILGIPILIDAAVDLYHRVQGQIGRSPHMHELVAIAFMASFASGQYIEAGSVAFFMIIASFIEDHSASGARRSIESLIKLTPTQATRLAASGPEQVEASLLRSGDRVLIQPGDQIPGDGVIVKGESTINESGITGESVPAEKAVGDEVFGGTLSLTGVLEVEITRAGSDTTLSRVQELILSAADSKPVAAKMIERYAGIYSPVVIMTAAILYLLTHNLGHSISLLLIACPCAIILSGPTAMVAAISASARLGVLIKGVTDLESARRINAVVFDKTGTLTTGNLEVVQIEPAPTASDSVQARQAAGAELLRLAASAEFRSRHPVARAVVRLAERAGVTLSPVDELTESAGLGVRAVVDGSIVLVGRPAWLEQEGVSLGGLDLSAAEGLSLLMVARDGRLLGWLGLEDRARLDADGVMRDLKAAGVRYRCMITGDRSGPADRVGNVLELDEWFAEAMPGDKLALVNDLKRRGYTVAVIGDGVNDGPALAAAHVSVAMGAAGSDIAIHASSIALMNNQLNRIPFLIKLSRATAAVIRQNLIFVLLYVFGMLTLLFFGFITPLIAAIAHGISSVIVIFNSARLIRQGEDVVDLAIPTADVRQPDNRNPVSTVNPKQTDRSSILDRVSAA